jgi:alpha-L-fucosidase 2
MKYLPRQIYFFFMLTLFYGCESRIENNVLNSSFRGVQLNVPAENWQTSFLTGNGTHGVMVPGDALMEKQIFCHEALFMPQYPPVSAPDLSSRLPEIRELILKGKNREAALLMVEEGDKVGIDEMIWTDPLVPACQMELEFLDKSEISFYERSVNYENGLVSTKWQQNNAHYLKEVFASRPDSCIVTRISGSEGSLNLRIRLSQLPIEEEINEQDQKFFKDELISKSEANLTAKGKLTFITEFKKKWESSLKGYSVESVIQSASGVFSVEGDWLHITNADEILIVSAIELAYEEPVVENVEADLEVLLTYGFSELLSRHKNIHKEMFNRFSINIDNDQNSLPANELQDNSTIGNLNPQLVNQVCQAARYELISSTGQLPPSLQGIWGGTWLPAWSGDFTLNGNVPSVISSGYNTNFFEINTAYMNYMLGMLDDFRDNASGLYDAPGIFVPSRTSSSGSTYHFFEDEYPHLFWFAGAAWASQVFYDYWQYSGNEKLLKEAIIPFMLESLEFYESILYKDINGDLHFIPSYSPEVGPKGLHPLAINATMDVAALKQLIRNLLKLESVGLIVTDKISLWLDIIDRLPDYEISKEGELKEWLYPGYENDNEHRHASHLYPLFYEVDPEFVDNLELKNAAKKAIENRMEYRRENEGGEMAFGLVQIGLAAAHINDLEHAYECIDFLCHSYWSKAFTSYHDPGKIFNLDISGGLPALISEMLVQSSQEEIKILPVLPEQWSSGKITGVRTRTKSTIDVEWENGRPTYVRILADKSNELILTYKKQSWDLKLKKGEVYEKSF